MKLFLFFTCFILILTSSSFLAKSESANIHQLVKRQDKLPFDSLPGGNCNTPSACSNIQQPATCHCNGIVTVCENSQGQFCWGSQSLTQRSACPSVPSPCKESFNSTASCLCNSEAVLCVDQHNHYCYGHIDATTSSVSLAAIPTGTQISPGSNSSPSKSLTPSQSGSTTTASSFGTLLTVSTQQIGWIIVLAFGSLTPLI